MKEVKSLLMIGWNFVLLPTFMNEYLCKFMRCTGLFCVVEIFSTDFSGTYIITMSSSNGEENSCGCTVEAITSNDWPHGLAHAPDGGCIAQTQMITRYNGMTSLTFHTDNFTGIVCSKCSKYITPGSCSAHAVWLMPSSSKINTWLETHLHM